MGANLVEERRTIVPAEANAFKSIKRKDTEMLSHTDALKTVLENIQTLDSEEQSLLKAQGQVLAEDIYAGVSLPLTNTAIPDGYAVRWEDIAGASREKPATLRIIGTAHAGYLPKRVLKPRTTMRIMTGSSLPQGTDCVVRFEDTDEPPEKNGPNKSRPMEVKIYVSGKPGANIRLEGSNVEKGSFLIPRGTAVGPAQISALASIGMTKIKVIRRPKIAVIATGDELIDFRSQLSPGKSYNCNTPAIAALITHYGGIPQVMGIARDNESSLLSKIKRSLSADAIITTGGVSMGDYDLVRLVIGKIGQVVFSRINMGPGRSFALGMINRDSKKGDKTPLPVLALSGPPAGCLNNFELLVRPAILKMLGFTRLDHPVVEAMADAAVPGKKPAASVKWTLLNNVDRRYRVEINRAENIGMLAEMATANSLTIIPEDTEIKQHERIQVLPLDWSRE